MNLNQSSLYSCIIKDPGWTVDWRAGSEPGQWYTADLLFIIKDPGWTVDWRAGSEPGQ